MSTCNCEDRATRRGNNHLTVVRASSAQWESIMLSVNLACMSGIVISIPRMYVYRSVKVSDALTHTPSCQGRLNRSLQTLLARLCLVPKRAAAARCLSFWLVTAQEHVVVQRPMPSSEQAISSVGLAVAAVLERNSADVPCRKKTPLKERERGRERDLVTERRMRMQREGDVAEESARRQKQTAGRAAVWSWSQDVGAASEEPSVRVCVNAP